MRPMKNGNTLRTALGAIIRKRVSIAFLPKSRTLVFDTRSAPTATRRHAGKRTGLLVVGLLPSGIDTLLHAFICLFIGFRSL